MIVLEYEAFFHELDRCVTSILDMVYKGFGSLLQD